LAKFSPKQLDFLLHSDTRVNILEGAIRSGKTVVTLVRWLLFVRVAPRGGELLIVGRTRDSAWRNMVAPLQDPDIFGAAAEEVVGNYGAPTVRILGRTVHVMGASDVKAEMVLRGMTVSGAMVDEVTTIPEQFFTQLLGRMSVKGAQLFGTTNPDSPAHWLKKKFLDRIGKGIHDWKRWSFTIDDNPGLEPEYVASIKSEFTGLWYRRFIEGEWVAAEGAIFDMWNPDEHIIRWGDLPPMARYLAVGMDYGTTNASAAVLLGLGTDNVLYFIDEWKYEATGQQRRLSDAELSQRLRTWMIESEHPDGEIAYPEWTIVDPAAASFKVQLSQDGVSNVINGDNNVLYGIRTMASLLAARKLKISSRCKGLIDEAPGYSWDPKATEKGDDKPLKMNDHSLDAARYALTTTETVWRQLIDVAA